MCNVCIASDVLRTSTCQPQSSKCPAFKEGYQVDFGGKSKRVAHRSYYKPKKGKARLQHVGYHGRIMFARAMGKDPEGPAKYQIRRAGEKWPKAWRETDDLADVVSYFGLEMGWGWLAGPMKAWINGERKTLPTSAEIIEWYDKREARRATERRRVRHTGRGRRTQAKRPKPRKSKSPHPSA